MISSKAPLIGPLIAAEQSGYFIATAYRRATMNISKPAKIIIGILTVFAVLFPFIMPVFVMFLIFSAGFPFLDPQSLANPHEFSKIFMPVMLIFYPTIMCFSLVQLGLQIFYLIHVIKNRVLTDTLRILFAIGTFLLPYIAMPIYFIVYLWNDKPQEPKSQPAEIAVG